MRSRPYAGENDAAAIRAMVTDAWSRVGPHFECSAPDIEWRIRRAPSPEHDVQLWLDEHGVAAIAWYYPNGYADLIIHPRARGAVEAEMIAWSSRRHAGAAGSLCLWALETNSSLGSALESAGFSPTAGCYLHLWRELTAPKPMPLPPGFVVRAVTEHELAARVEVHREAFAPSKLTPELYARVMASPMYSRELDVVVADSAGELRAFVLAWFDPANRLGLFEPVGTHPSSRRLGLARAAGAEALHRLASLGARQAIVGALGDDPGSRALYESLGFRVIDRNLGYSPDPHAK